MANAQMPTSAAVQAPGSRTAARQSRGHSERGPASGSTTNARGSDDAVRGDQQQRRQGQRERRVVGSLGQGQVAHGEHRQPGQRQPVVPPPRAGAAMLGRGARRRALLRALDAEFTLSPTRGPGARSPFRRRRSMPEPALKGTASHAFRHSGRAQLKPALSIVIPLFNEVESLPELHASLSEVLDRLPQPAEMIFVDDGSTDGSMEAVRRLSERDPRVRGVQFRRNYGKSAALAAGLARAAGQYLITLDADLQDDPAEIPRLLDKLDEGYDLVSGWKRGRADPLLKRATSRIFNRVTGSAHRRAAARHQLRPQGVSPRGHRHHPRLWAVAPLPSRAGVEGGLSPGRDRREAPSAQVRPQQVRRCRDSPAGSSTW